MPCAACYSLHTGRRCEAPLHSRGTQTCIRATNVALDPPLLAAVSVCSSVYNCQAAVAKQKAVFVPSHQCNRERTFVPSHQLGWQLFDNLGTKALRQFVSLPTLQASRTTFRGKCTLFGTVKTFDNDAQSPQLRSAPLLLFCPKVRVAEYTEPALSESVRVCSTCRHTSMFICAIDSTNPRHSNLPLLVVAMSCQAGGCKQLVTVC